MTQPTLRPLHVAYVGNFGATHSTESHVAQALEANGHTVDRWQENAQPGGNCTTFAVLAEALQFPDAAWQRPDLILWTRTGWDWGAVVDGKAEQAHDEQRAMLAAARAAGVPTVGYHLDRWWGLDRQGQVMAEPFFRCDMVVTADGGHDLEWAAAGVNHQWFPPAVSQAEAERRPTPKAARSLRVGPVLFVGSATHYHPEWAMRLELINQLRGYFGRRFEVVERGYRGQRLVDLYAAARVIVGDSCLAPKADGSPMTHYWSDRIPETLGRGGFLIHPEVAGLAEHFVPGQHLMTYPVGDWAALFEAIDYHLTVDGGQDRVTIAAAGREHVLAHHTYELRMRQLQALLTEWGLVLA